MLGRLRKPFLVLAIVLNLALVLAEAGPPENREQSITWLSSLQKTATITDNEAQAQKDLKDFFPDSNFDTFDRSQPPVQLRYGLRSLWLVDSLLLFTLLLFGLGVVLAPESQGRIQGVLTLLFSLFIITKAMALIFEAIGEVVLMIALLVSVPLGTIAYFIQWGFFNRSGAAVILSLFFTVKLFIAISVVLAHQNFLTNRRLVILFMIALATNILVSFLHGLVPAVLVSISDAIAGIVVGSGGALLALCFLCKGIKSTIAVFRQ